MRVTTYAIKPDRTAEDRRYLQMAIDESQMYALDLFLLCRCSDCND